MRRTLLTAPSSTHHCFAKSTKAHAKPGMGIRQNQRPFLDKSICLSPLETMNIFPVVKDSLYTPTGGKLEEEKILSKWMDIPAQLGRNWGENWWKCVSSGFAWFVFFGREPASISRLRLDESPLAMSGSCCSLSRRHER